VFTTHYHHGETNVGNNIVNQAQDFVGSNNVNLLVPVGTRHMGGVTVIADVFITLSVG
jgi:DNA topoisomerase II